MECFMCEKEVAELVGREGNLCEPCNVEAEKVFAAETALLSSADELAKDRQPVFWQDSLDPESGPGDHTLPHWMFDREEG